MQQQLARTVPLGIPSVAGMGSNFDAALMLVYGYEGGPPTSVQ